MRTQIKRSTHHRTSLIVAILLMLTIVLAGCGKNGAAESAQPTPDVAATVQAEVAAGIQATQEAEAALAEQIDAAVASALEATTQAQAATQPTAEATPVPTASNTTETVVIETESVVIQTTETDTYVTMTEEELADLIDQAVNEAVAATESAAATTASATEDETVTEDEVQTIEVTISGAEEAVAAVEELLDYYYSTYYAEYHGENSALVQELAAIEEELSTLNSNLETMNQTLVEINETVNAGLTLAEETIDQLETAAASATAAALQAQDLYYDQFQTALELYNLATSSPEDLASVMADVETALALVNSLSATQIPANQQEALALAMTYATELQQVMGDGTVTQAELMAVAQTGVNAAAGLSAVGGPQMQNMAGLINSLNQQVAQQDLQGATQQLSQLRGLMAQPNVQVNPPSAPSGDRPSIPQPGGVTRPSRP